MLFIAEDPVHVVVRNEMPRIVDRKGGIVRPEKRRLYAKFERGLAPEWARTLGRAAYDFKRMPEGVTAEQWLAFYDSVEEARRLGWDDEERQAIEEKLLTLSSVMQVEPPRMTPPWPAYDKIAAGGSLTASDVAEKIASKVSEDGHDAAYVIAYESQNRARQDVLDALAPLAVAAPIAAPAPIFPDAGARTRPEAPPTPDTHGRADGRWPVEG